MNRETSSDKLFGGHEHHSLTHRHRKLLTQKRTCSQAYYYKVGTSVRHWNAISALYGSVSTEQRLLLNIKHTWNHKPTVHCQRRL